MQPLSHFRIMLMVTIIKSYTLADETHLTAKEIELATVDTDVNYNHTVLNYVASYSLEISKAS